MEPLPRAAPAFRPITALGAARGWRQAGRAGRAGLLPGAAGSPRGPGEGKPVIPLREARTDLRAAPKCLRLPSDRREGVFEDAPLAHPRLCGEGLGGHLVQ